MKPDRHLQIYALRLLRQVLRLKDEFYLRYVSRAELIPQILRSFQQRGEQRRDSLLIGALAETLLLLCRDPLPTLLIPLWTRYGDTLLQDTLLGDSATPALQELHDTLRHAAMQCIGMIDGTPVDAIANTSVIAGGTGGVFPTSSGSEAHQRCSDWQLLPRSENLRLREQSDEDEYLFGDDVSPEGDVAESHAGAFNEEANEGE